MPPDRERDSSVGLFKLYSRPSTPDASSGTDIANKEPDQPIPTASKPGFPTYEQYKEIEDAYLKTLPSVRREKALISQATFDRIWAVLHCYDSIDETPQFRFWVRKKFILGNLNKDADSKDLKPPSDSASESQSESSTGCDLEEPRAKQQMVLLHRQERNLIAVREQIYDIICYGHGVSNHGGRDKTVSFIRKHYTWIPKELIAQFIKACPTCIAKKCGMKETDTLTAHTAKTLRGYLRKFGAIGDSDDEQSERPPNQAVQPIASEPERPQEMSSIVPSESSRPMDRFENLTAPADLRAPQSAAMSREVSLYQGLPNGWQFRHSDFAAAQDEFMVSKNSTLMPSAGARIGRPRVPSIAPMMRAISEPLQGQVQGQGQENHAFAAIPSRLNESHVEVNLAPSPPRPVAQTLEAVPTSLGSSDTVSDSTSFELLPSPYSNSPKTLTAVPATPITRAAAPSPLSLDIQALSSPGTAQPFMNCHTPERNIPRPPNAMAANLESPLYTLAMVAATESMSPPNTALPTPVDSVFRAGAQFDDMIAKELGQKAGMTLVNLSTEAVYGDHGPGVVVL
ncbi:hypothetical protein H0H92_005230 [Tricholoma furcatifolium]|nr:hypothetical protein H0H92_005230 [Tricholoma furcatifolium]